MACSNIRGVLPLSSQEYFFDSNVWLCILDGYYQKHYKKPYLDFLQLIFNWKSADKPMVLVSSLLLSEIVNRLIRDVYFADFKVKFSHLADINSPQAFKKIYRKHQQFATDYRIIFQNIKAYQSCIKLIDDNFSSYRLKDVLKDNSKNLDFNDFIYSKLAKKHSAILVSDDVDYSGLSINILTVNQKLLPKS